MVATSPVAVPREMATSVQLERRTFAIISHPDAGKTTLTEKLLLFGGAIRLAGQVKARGDRRRTRSDWMAIERERGISISSSVMTFERDGIIFNLLDTPGHEDFSEDTYRTLTAVDSAIMVIDAAKGIESQTRKLFEVCRLRDIPIVTFINKVDREGRDPFELLDEIESTLALEVSPIIWPVGIGMDFHGCFDIGKRRFLTSSGSRGEPFNETIQCAGPYAEEIEHRLPKAVWNTFRESVELAMTAYKPFDVGAFKSGHRTPVFFGSALKDYAVGELLAFLGTTAPAPGIQRATPRNVDPMEEQVTGFVFKVQANMDPNHRDRVAFVRLCSGRFHRGMKLTQVRTGRSFTIRAPTFFLGQDRQLAEEALPGDIIGIPNHGTLRMGDSLTEGEQIRFSGLPDFAPEILRRVRGTDTMRSKQLRRGLSDLAEEGVVQLFHTAVGGHLIVGLVGLLQLEVLTSRMEAEYKIPVLFEVAPYEAARWIVSDDASALKRFMERYRNNMAEDRSNAWVFLARNEWDMKHTAEEWPEIRFLRTRERT
jgi:peptide chain release factor 3